MKKLVMSAFMAAIILHAGNVAADEIVAIAPAPEPITAPASTPAPIPTPLEQTPASNSLTTKGSAWVNSMVSLVPAVNFASSQEWVSKNKWFVGGGAALFAGIALMYKTCPWFKRLIGCEDEAVTRKPRTLDYRVTNPKRG
jgi:hypothetical protein